MSEVRDAFLRNGEIDSFYKTELKAMWKLGWPMLISFFCRFAMFSMDSGFIGHIPPGRGPAPVPEGSLAAAFLLAAPTAGAASFEYGTGADVLGNALVAGLMADSSNGTGTSLRQLSAPVHGTKEFLAAASLGDMLCNLLFVPLLAVCFGLNPLVAQAVGSGNKHMAGTWLQLALFLGTIATIPAGAAFFFVGDALHLLGFDKNLAHLAGIYAMFNAIWVVPNSWYVSMRYYFQAQGIARPAMWAGLIFLALNAGFCWCFTFGGPFAMLQGPLNWAGLGFIGAAISISVSRCLQCVAYWFYMFVWRKAHKPTWPGWSTDFLQWRYMQPFLAQVVPQVGTMLLQFGISQSNTLLVARLGTLAVASSAAATQATMPFTLCFMGALAGLGAIRVGMRLGKGEAAEARKTAWLVLGLGVCCTLVLACILLPLRREAMSLMTNDQEVRDLAVELLPPVILQFLSLCCVQTGTGGILAAQGRTGLSTLLSLCIELPLSLGIVAILVLVYQADVRLVYWVQALVGILEAFIVMIIVLRSDWDYYACKAQERQQARMAPAPAAAPEETLEGGMLSLQPQDHGSVEEGSDGQKAEEAEQAFPRKGGS